MKMLQVRNVPDDVHRALKERAAREGTTMSDLVLRELPRLAHKPSPEQVMARIRDRSPVGGPPAAELIANERDQRHARRRRQRHRRTASGAAGCGDDRTRDRRARIRAVHASTPGRRGGQRAQATRRRW